MDLGGFFFWSCWVLEDLEWPVIGRRISFHALFLIAWLADGDSLTCSIVMMGRQIAKMVSTFPLWWSLFLMCSNSLNFLCGLSMTLKQSTQKFKHVIHVLIELLTLTDYYSVHLHIQFMINHQHHCWWTVWDITWLSAIMCHSGKCRSEKI